MTNKFDCTIIEDDGFMNKDVSLLEKDDFYLFHVSGDNTVYLYKDGVISIGVASAGCVDGTGIECGSHIEYTKGSLKDYLIKTLGDCDDNTI